MNEERFYKVYSHLPINLRNEIIIIFPETGPITWSVAYLEIKNKTELGNKIVNKLIELRII